jgi:predicted enzyme related to lactoylglutathione lyase
MTLRIEGVNFDCHDPQRVARFWAAALGRDAQKDEDDPPAWYLEADADGPELIFVLVPEGKEVKNRVHLDLRPDDQAAEVERLLGLGATRAEIGQTGQESWVVLADVEGNEFCVLRSQPAKV